jgi:tetratricopeptide (TPR) repeat protein
LAGSSFRQPLLEADLQAGTLPIGDELWLIFRIDADRGRSRGLEGTELELACGVGSAAGVGTQIRVARLEKAKGETDLAQSPVLADWYREREATTDDDLIVRVLDVKERRYAVDLQSRGEEALEAAISERNQVLAEVAHKIARAGRPFVINLEMLPRLVSHDVYRCSPPPDPWPRVLRPDLRFVVDRYEINLAGRLVDGIEKEQAAPADPRAYPRPRGSRDRARSEDVRQAWGRYLFDQGMEWRWAGYDREAEAYYKETLRLDPGHADAWVHVGNIRFEDGHLCEALPLYERGEAAALERTIGDPDRYGAPYWLDLDSRPYMRALHGRGLCLYRLGRVDEAGQVFERMLELNPNDNQGVRFLLSDLKEGLTWEQSVKRDEERFP